MTKVYRVSCRTEADNHFGYTFHATKAEAQQRADEFLSDWTKDVGAEAEIETIIIPPGRDGLITALNMLAGHCDNG